MHRRSAGGRRHIGRPPPSSAALTRSDRRTRRRHPPRRRCRPRSRPARRAAEPIALYVARRLPSLPIQPSSSRKGRWQRRVLAQAALNRPTDRSGEPNFHLAAYATPSTEFSTRMRLRLKDSRSVRHSCDADTCKNGHVCARREGTYRPTQLKSQAARWDGSGSD